MEKEKTGQQEEKSAFCIGMKLKKLSNLLCRRRVNDPVFKRAEVLTGTHGWILDYIIKNEKIFQRDVEKKFNIRRSTATKMLQLMEKNGLIVRQPDPTDSRLKQILPTQAATEINEMVHMQLFKTEEVLQRGIDQNEINFFCDILDRMAQNLKDDEEANRC